MVQPSILLSLRYLLEMRRSKLSLENIFILSHPKPVGYLKARVIKDEIEIISILIDKKLDLFSSTVNNK